MDELDDRSQLVVLRAPVPAGAGHQNHQGGPQALSTTGNNIIGHLPDQNNVRMQALTNNRVNGSHVLCDQFCNQGRCHGHISNGSIVQ
jgi:hypothetical protein